MKITPCGAGDLDPVILRVVLRHQLHLGRIDDLQIADAVAGKAERHHRLRVKADAARPLAIADEGMHFVGVAHEMPGERELVVAVVKDQRPATSMALFLPPGIGGGGHLPGGARCAPGST